MEIQFSARPDDGVAPTVNANSYCIELIYDRSIPPAEGETSNSVPQTVRVPLDARMSCATKLTDASNGNLLVNVLTADGSSMLSRTVAADGEGDALLTFKEADVNKIDNHQQAVPGINDTTPLTTTRTVKLVPTGNTTLNYQQATVLVSPVINQEALTASKLDEKLNSGGKQISSLEITDLDPAPLTRLTWIPTHLAVDGTFTATFPQQQSIGWIWWLTGDRQVLGFAPDDLSAAGTKSMGIALPVLSAKKINETGTADKDCDCNKRISANVTEAELANNPGVYSEDPGAFCKPFSNPERVLSEKSFAVIARVTQPEIGALGSIKTRTIKLLNMEGDSATAGGANNGGGSFNKLLRAGVSNALAFVDPAFPDRHKLIDRYADLLNRLPSGRATIDAKHPVQWEDDIAQYQAATVSLGHILEFRVRWRSNGYSLGTVAKTLTLAPRQTKRIQKIEWKRNEQARRSELTKLGDNVDDSVVRERDYHDEVAANLSEWSSGSSDANSEGIAFGVGAFFAPGVVAGVGGGIGGAHSSSQEQGGRDTTASENQRLRDSIRRHGDALRKFESTVINEVHQEEDVTGTTEVIRNANYAHSLTVIYYQILRHLKVTTEFAGVRECLFVPFAIKPFDIQRAYRWRDAIRASIRSIGYSRALRYLKDVATNFTTSDIPPGTRAEQQLISLRGSIYVNLAIERPMDLVKGGFDDSHWSVLKPLLQYPAMGIFSQLSGIGESGRDAFFQVQYASAVAARWVKYISLIIGKGTIQVDASLATRYAFNQTVRIDFTVPAKSLVGLRRADLQHLSVVSGIDLPAGSVANITRISFTYNTARLEHSVEGNAGMQDLITVNGQANSANVSVPLDSWESVDERLELTRCVNELTEHLNEHLEYYHKAIWWRMDRDRLMMLLDGFYVPNTNNVSIASVVDREPVGIIGNCIVYRVGAASFLGNGKITEPKELYNLYAEKEPISDPLFISLPTDGLYAQTIMDECMALEEHYGNIDWVLNDKEPDLGNIDPSLLQTRRSDSTAGTTPTNFPSTIINLQNAPDAPSPSGLQGVLNAVTNPNAFRDMAGLAGTQANAQAALNTAANLATNFGNQAAALEMAKLAKAEQGTKNADQKLASIENAKKKGLTTDADAAAHAKEVLSAMNPDSPKATAPHENPAINSAIDTVKNIPGSSIEATTSEGGVKVRIGGEENTFADATILSAPTSSSAQNRAFNPQTNDKTGVITMAINVANIPSGGSVRWSVPLGVTGHFTLAGGGNFQSGPRAEITALMPGRTNINVEVLDALGTAVASVKYQLCIPQFVTVGVDSATFTPLLQGYGLMDFEIEEVIRVAKSVVDTVLNGGNVRTVWQMPPFNEVLPLQFAGVAAGNVTKAMFRGDPPRPGVVGRTLDRNGNEVFVGPEFFDENIDVFPGGYDDPVALGAVQDVDDVTLKIVATITAAALTSSPEKNVAIKVLGRLYGETLAHEICHSLIGGTLSDFSHNAHPGTLDDLMNHGSDRSFEKRTGFVINPAQIGVVSLSTLLANDRGVFFINIPTTRAKEQIDTHFPVPPMFQ